MTVRLALSLSAAAALGSALASLAVGTPTMFGVSLAASMALGLAADLIGRCRPSGARAAVPKTGWGGYCDGATFPDGTKWHTDNFAAPFVGRVWNPIVCVVADAPAPPPLAGPGGCGGAVR